MRMISGKGVVGTGPGTASSSSVSKDRNDGVVVLFFRLLELLDHSIKALTVYSYSVIACIVYCSSSSTTLA